MDYDYVCNASTSELIRELTERGELHKALKDAPSSILLEEIDRREGSKEFWRGEWKKRLDEKDKCIERYRVLSNELRAQIREQADRLDNENPFRENLPHQKEQKRAAARKKEWTLLFAREGFAMREGEKSEKAAFDQAERFVDEAIKRGLL